MMMQRMGKLHLKAKLCETCGIKYLSNPVSKHYHKHNGKKFTARNIGWNREYMK